MGEGGPLLQVITWLAETVSLLVTVVVVGFAVTVSALLVLPNFYGDKNG